MKWLFGKSANVDPDTTVATPAPSWDQAAITFPVLAGDRSETALLLAQLVEEGYGTVEADRILIRWSEFYRLASSEEYRESVPRLGLPPFEAWRPTLESFGSLTDSDFSIAIRDWSDPIGNPVRSGLQIQGGAMVTAKRTSMLLESTWKLVEAVAAFAATPVPRGAMDNRLAWAEIRKLALEAGADLTDFLRNTIVLTPDRLQLELRKGAGLEAKVVEVIPHFEEAPARWLEMFDRWPSVPERYDVPDGAGLVQVLVSPEVKKVLGEIRRMPGRRITGERAEAFLRNPFASLGEDAAKVIDPAQFEAARDAAGIAFARFTAKVCRDDRGFPYHCAIQVEEVIAGEPHSHELPFQGAPELQQFLTKLTARIEAGAECCHWRGFDLEILGDSADQAQILREALAAMVNPPALQASELFDLSHYSDRVEGFGVERPYYSPFIARKDEASGWFPENIAWGLSYTPEGSNAPLAIALDEHSLPSFEKELQAAREHSQEEFTFPGCPKPIPVQWAEQALLALQRAKQEVSRGEFAPKVEREKAGAQRRGLVVKPNVDELDYEERRGKLSAEIGEPCLPAALLPTVSLKEHQRTGLAWLQKLWRESPTVCRGGLLADDMGLGKTIQILTFLMALAEQSPDIDPFLIVAPVSLLENWQEELKKFFRPDAIEVLTLYGPALAKKRVPKKQVDPDLLDAGATRLLVHGWRGTAKLVLTTYETLRDLEFSLARERWSVVVCDEAQKIKNPNALVTRAAKKQNARFKLACTGTPVENTLTDIWCLFDFIQPGLLGALRGFGQRYRRPIEAETEDERRCVEELRGKLMPQMLRRTKAEVAKDLPAKIEAPTCRSLPLSARQRFLYAEAVQEFRRRESASDPSPLHTPLGLLQYLRRVCSDPPSTAGQANGLEPVHEIERQSPKMAWLVEQLKQIRASGEKSIVFCELRELQRKLQHVILERFGFLPDVVNGDTTTESANAHSRQKRIRAFQEKPGFGVIILSPLAVGFGVNIQAANHVIHFTRTWNPAKEDQATDRAYRIGQTKDVYVYYPVVTASDFVTFDQKLDELLAVKRELSRDVLNGSDEVSASDFGDLEVQLAE